MHFYLCKPKKFIDKVYVHFNLRTTKTFFKSNEHYIYMYMGMQISLACF